MRRDASARPKPTEKRSTFTPHPRGTEEWPSSWTMTRVPSATANATSVTNRCIQQLSAESTEHAPRAHATARAQTLSRQGPRVAIDLEDMGQIAQRADTRARQ